MDDIQYTQYYVAFLDILGFKDRVNDPLFPCQDILKMYNQFGIIHKDFYEGETGDIVGNVKMKIMSDSICLYIPADIPNALFFLTLFCVDFQYELLNMPHCTFVRGGITFGDMYAKDDIVFGPALTEAYLLEEKNARVPRIIIRKKTLDHGMEKADEKSRQAMKFWIFQDEDAFYAMNYFKILYQEGHQDTREKVKKLISHWLDTTVNESIRQKYLYVKKQIQNNKEGNTDA